MRLCCVYLQLTLWYFSFDIPYVYRQLVNLCTFPVHMQSCKTFSSYALSNSEPDVKHFPNTIPCNFTTHNDSFKFRFFFFHFSMQIQLLKSVSSRVWSLRRLLWLNCSKIDPTHTNNNNNNSYSNMCNNSASHKCLARATETYPSSSKSSPISWRRSLRMNRTKD